MDRRGGVGEEVARARKESFLRLVRRRDCCQLSLIDAILF